MYKAIVFDLDGTIIDSERLNLKYKCEKCRQMNVKIKRKDILLSFGLGKEEATAYYKKLTGREDIYLLLREYRREKTREHIQKHGLPIKLNVVAVLKSLRKNGILCGLATSTESNLLAFYNEFFPFSDYFDVIATNDVVKNGKPNPEIYFTTIKKLGLLPSEVLVVEDSYNGLQSAHAAGADTIYIRDIVPLTKEEKKIATFIGDDINDVLAYIN